MHNNHDSSYKFLFSNPELVRDLILGFIPDPWLHGLDFTTLERVSGSYISDDLKARSDDVVWRIKTGKDWFYLYLLIEFQSTVDPYMALRMMVYVGLLYQDLIKQKQLSPTGLLPPILPIVLYNGLRPWQAPTNISDLIPAVPGLVEHFKPKMQYLLINESDYSEQTLASLKNLVAAVFRIEQAPSPETVKDLVVLLGQWLADRPDLGRMMGKWLRATLQRKEHYRMIVPETDDLQGIGIMLADRLEEWALGYIEQGKKEGLTQGMQQGEAKVLITFLVKRFGSIPTNYLTLITEASREQIELWLDQVLEVPTLESLFTPS